MDYTIDKMITHWNISKLIINDDISGDIMDFIDYLPPKHTQHSKRSLQNNDNQSSNQKPDSNQYNLGLGSEFMLEIHP